MPKRIVHPGFGTQATTSASPGTASWVPKPGDIQPFSPQHHIAVQTLHRQLPHKEKYSEPITVDEIAGACGPNRSYLTRIFKHATGYTPQSYLLTYRMKKASALLKDSNESIANIAFLVGYSDAYTFSKAFKRCKELSPTEYRAKHAR